MGNATHGTSVTIRNAGTPVYFDIDYHINVDDQVEIDKACVADGCGDDIAALLKPWVIEDFKAAIANELKSHMEFAA